MSETPGHILVVDDNKMNRMLLRRMLENQGHRVSEAEDGMQALEMLQTYRTSTDVILLDILMPGLDGYQLLERIKADPQLRYLPVIMVSALDELDSVVRCIQIGATDYLTKPITPPLLQARLHASLAEKRLRDLEIEYLEQVNLVVGAAQAVESSAYEPATLDGVAARADALGNLARVFQRMAREVHLREQRLKQQLAQLQLDMAEMQRARDEPLHVYLPMDRRHALSRGTDIPDRANGAVLFADMSDFTALTAALAREFGGARGPEEMTRLINQLFDALIRQVHDYRGSVISFAGDAITCWFADRPAGGVKSGAGTRALAAALAMQEAVRGFVPVLGKMENAPTPQIKVAVACGPVRRFLVGDPSLHVLEALAGETLNVLAAGEQLAGRGEALAEQSLVEQLEVPVEIAEWRTDGKTGATYGAAARLLGHVPPEPWEDLPADALPHEACRPWLLPSVYNLVRSSTRQFLSELRPAAALFMKFSGLDFDHDDAAPARLNDLILWVQGVVSEQEGAVLQITFGDKGSYLYAAFGAPVAHRDDAARAVQAALALSRPPAALGFVSGVQIGAAYGLMRAGGYGGPARRTYGVLGEKVNLAARLMQAAGGGILCDEAIMLAARDQFVFKTLEPIRVKGSALPLAVYQPVGRAASRGESSPDAMQSRMDALSPSEQLALKFASVIGLAFDASMLAGLLPAEEGGGLAARLGRLVQIGMLSRETGGAYRFRSEYIRRTAYDSMLFAQRRTLHRQAAEWVETRPELGNRLEELGVHWELADEPLKAIRCFERAAQQAREAGAHAQAAAFLQRCLALEEKAAVLSGELGGSG